MASGCVPSRSAKTVPFRIHFLLISFLVATLMNQMTPKNAPPDDLRSWDSDLFSVLNVPPAPRGRYHCHLGFLFGVHPRRRFFSWPTGAAPGFFASWGITGNYV